MSLKTEHIVKLMQLKGLGRSSLRRLLDIKFNRQIINDKDLTDFLNFAYHDKLIPNLQNYSSSDITAAFRKGNEILELSEKLGISIIPNNHTDFPQLLNLIDDPPVILNFLGEYKSLNKIHGVAVIGTREPSAEGVQSGQFFGELLSKNGFNVVSGLAIGCDTAAHSGAVKASGFTTAIMAHGLHTIYPKENKSLAEEILYNGGVIMSEYCAGTNPLPSFFVERDRLQAGLSLATLVIQSGIKGETMHAVNAALLNYRLLAAVKYKVNIDSDKRTGNDLLISDYKAFPLTSRNASEFLRLLKSKIRPIPNLVPSISSDRNDPVYLKDDYSQE